MIGQESLEIFEDN